MKIGVFDSGLGGLLIAHSLVNDLPEYDYVYLGDSARVPYGNRSMDSVYEFTEQAVRYLFDQDCQLVIIACNTASAEALRRIQQEYLPHHNPDQHVLGVLVPAAEETVSRTSNKRVGVLATKGTVNSGAFVSEIKKLDPEVTVVQQAAPLLVPLIENSGVKWVGPILDEYLKPLLEASIDSLILGSTHYPYLKAQIKERVGEVSLISQDEFIPAKLRGYLDKHVDLDSMLSKNQSHEFLLTDVTDDTRQLAAELFGRELELKRVTLT